MTGWQKFRFGSSIMARAARGSAVSGLGYIGGQGLRLASNLILTRLLFPEAFGLMALVTMVVVGVAMMTDLGLVPSIMQSKRGDDPKFLETAWSVKLIMHGFYFVTLCLLAAPMARFYDEPQLAQLIPAVAVAVLIGGLVAPNLEHAARHIRPGPGVIADMGSQSVALTYTAIHAWLTGSVWALPMGQIVGSVARVVITRVILPGPAIRPQWDRAALRELFGFGKWIMLGSLSGFLLGQGDKAILGKYLTMEMLGIYNIGFFLAAFPQALARHICGATMIPIYRESPPHASAQNFATVRRMRFILSGTVLEMIAVMGLGGPLLVSFLYDARYAEAGQIVSLIACTQIAHMIGMTYPSAALAAGDSRTPSLLTMLYALVQIIAFVVGVELGGLHGAILTLAVVGWVMHGSNIYLARRHRVWDRLHDMIIGGAGLLLTAAILTLHPPF